MRKLIAVFPETEQCLAAITDDGRKICFLNGNQIFSTFPATFFTHQFPDGIMIKSIYSFERTLLLLAEDGKLFILSQDASAALEACKKLGLPGTVLVQSPPMIPNVVCNRVSLPNATDFFDLAISADRLIFLDTEGLVNLNAEATKSCGYKSAIKSQKLPNTYLLNIYEDKKNPFASVTIGNDFCCVTTKKPYSVKIFINQPVEQHQHSAACIACVKGHGVVCMVSGEIFPTLEPWFKVPAKLCAATDKVIYSLSQENRISWYEIQTGKKKVINEKLKADRDFLAMAVAGETLVLLKEKDGKNGETERVKTLLLYHIPSKNFTKYNLT